MGHKNTDPCLQKAFDDERLFVLMARDPTAPLVIAEWIKLNMDKQPAEKLMEAADCAIEMSKRCKEFIQRKEEVKKRQGLVDKLAKKNLSRSAEPDPEQDINAPLPLCGCDSCRELRNRTNNPNPLLNSDNAKQENSAHGFTKGADVPPQITVKGQNFNIKKFPSGPKPSSYKECLDPAYCNFPNCRCDE